MKSPSRQFLLATAALIGTIIGVGIFEVPYATASVGVGLAAFYFVLLAAVQLLQHLFYAEAAIASPEKARLPGLAKRFIGSRAGRVAGFATVLSYWGSLLAYIVAGGTFLHALLAPLLSGSPFVYRLAWATVGSVIVWFGLAFVSELDFWATLGLIGAMFVIFFWAAPHVSLENFRLFSSGDPFMPYGIILFSLSGFPIVAEMQEIVGGDRRRYRAAIIVGSLVAAALTAGFAFLIYGVSGVRTTSDTVTGLRAAMGGGISFVAALFGFLAVATSFLASAQNLKHTFIYDYRLSGRTAWLATVSLPVGLFLLGAQDLSAIVSFTGAVFGGLQAFIIAWLYVRVTRAKAVTDRPLGVPLPLAYVSMVLLSAGAFYEVAVTAIHLMS